jgi:hypothetical protein
MVTSKKILTINYTNMKTLKFLAQIILLIIAISSCNKDNNEVNERTPGYFILAELNNNESSSLKSTENISTSTFDFGDLKASKEFFFLLVNGGDEPIFEIALSTDNSQFNIRPSQVDQLSGGTLLDIAENTGLIPILTLGITHGTNLNGVGYDNLLPMGINTSILTISGKTIDNGDTINISNSYDILVNAQMMDVELYEGSSKINLTNPDSYGSWEQGGLGWIRIYYVNDTCTISIKNIGNVDIDLYYGNRINQNNHMLISQSDSISINPVDLQTIIILDSKGTITDNTRIQLGSDGRGILQIMRINDL